MKKVIVIFLTQLISIAIYSQIPYFAGTVGNGKIYGYTSLKVRPGIDQIESYNTFQFGLGNHFAIGSDISINGQDSYYGFLLRTGFKGNKYFNIGAQITPSFNLSKGFALSYITSALYLNGSISNDDKLFWVANTWYGINRYSKDTIDQWLYLGYTLNLSKSIMLTPMGGCLYSWEMNRDAELSLGIYISYRNLNFYFWGNDFFRSHPRIVIGVDFSI